MTMEPYVTAIELADDRARIILAPDQGAAILRYDWIEHGTVTPIFRPAPPICRTTSDFAMITMLPWVNRISGGGFHADGLFHALEPNVAGQPFPIHGNGFQKSWSIMRRTGTSVDFSLTSDGPGLYRYRADYSFTLAAGALTVSLSITNLASITLPFGVGFHPWIIRHPDTTLAATASRFWLEDQQHLPTTAVPVASEPTLDFRTARVLPSGWINTSFEGWDGEATLWSPTSGQALRIEAPAPLKIYHLYSPNADAGFVCFEPVSHIVDGFNRRDAVETPPNDRLLPGAALRADCRFTPIIPG